VTAVDWSALSDALLRVERLGEQESGMLAFGMSDSGGVFVERGRVCFIGARGLGQRLRESLRPNSNHAAGRLGALAPFELEQALRQHSAECLLALCREPLPTRWAAHAGRGYAPRFTFRPVDMLIDAVGLSFPAQRARARAVMSQLAGPGRRAAAFVIDAEREVLLPVAEVGGHGVDSLRVLGQWVATFPRASLELATDPCFTLAATGDGEAVLIWWRDGVLFTVMCEDRATLATVTAQHMTCA
jgi:hypothetical protein